MACKARKAPGHGETAQPARRFPPVAFAKQNNRTLGAFERERCGTVHDAEALRRTQVGNHHGERFLEAMLARAQEFDSRGIRSVHGEVKSAETFDSGNLSAAQAIRCLRDGVLARDALAVAVQKFQVADRIPSTQSAARGIGGREDRCIRVGRPGTSEIRPWMCRAGHTEYSAQS